MIAGSQDELPVSKDLHMAYSFDGLFIAFVSDSEILPIFALDFYVFSGPLT